jgi:LAO/AO transport system kinase
MQKSFKKRFTPEEYAEGILAHDRVMLSRAITLTESRLSSDRELADVVLEKIIPFSGRSFRLGLTGVPGVGKSTFTESFGKNLLNEGFRLAVLAVDPSSQVSGGSILGDKTRMEWLAAQKNAFIRPSPSGDSLGGVGRRTHEAILLCEAGGFDFIIVETVGVGQSETLISEMTDFFLLLMLAGAGDELQGIKRGIMELADAVVITKADGDNAEKARQAKQSYANALHLFPPKNSMWIPETHISSALTDMGMSDICEMLRRFEQTVKANLWFEKNRSEQNLRRLRQLILQRLEEDFLNHSLVKIAFEEMKKNVKTGAISPNKAAEKLIDIFRKN